MNAKCHTLFAGLSLEINTIEGNCSFHFVWVMLGSLEMSNVLTKHT